MCRYCDYFRQKSYIKIDTLRGKNPTEIHGSLGEVCGEFTVDRSTFSRWANRFRGACVSIDNDPRSGRSRISTGERIVTFVADALEDRGATCEELSSDTGAKTSRENAPQLFVAHSFSLHDNACPHIAGVVTRKLVIMDGKRYLVRTRVQT